MRFPHVYSSITNFIWGEFSFVNEKWKSGMEIYPSFLVKYMVPTIKKSSDDRASSA